MKLLVVNNSYDFRSTFIEYFQDKGYNTKSVSNGKHALKNMRNEEFDLVILDVDIPVMNGIETVKRMKELKNNPNFIILAGNVTSEKYRYYELGCLHFEKKPVDIVELELKVSNLLKLIKNKSKREIPLETHLELDINTVYDFILYNIDNYNLNVDMITDELSINKKQLYKRINEVLTISVHEMIKNIRLLKARELVYRGKVKTIKELSSKVGYSDSGYFTKIFKSAFEEDLLTLIKRRKNKLDLYY